MFGNVFRNVALHDSRENIRYVLMLFTELDYPIAMA